MLHPVYEELICDIVSMDCPVILFDGYSDTGYANPDALKEAMRDRIINIVASAPDGVPVYVVAGATKVGIGAVYEVADILKSEGYSQIRTVGIVSEKANQYPDDIHPGLDYFIDIPDPEGTWKVLTDKGNSYMIDVLKHSSDVRACFMGGGKVAKSELEELENFANENPDPSKAVIIEISRDGVCAPNPVKVEKAIVKAAAEGRVLESDDYQFYGTKDFMTGVFSGLPERTENMTLT